MHGTTGRAMDLSSQGLSPRKIDEKNSRLPTWPPSPWRRSNTTGLKFQRSYRISKMLVPLIHRDDLFVFLTIQLKKTKNKSKTKQKSSRRLSLKATSLCKVMSLSFPLSFWRDFKSPSLPGPGLRFHPVAIVENLLPATVGRVVFTGKVKATVTTVGVYDSQIWRDQVTSPHRSHLILEHSFVNVGLHFISLTEGADWSQKNKFWKIHSFCSNYFTPALRIKASNLKSLPMPVPQLSNEIKCRNRSF